MSSSPQHNALNQLRRYKRLLVFGSGLLTTIMMLLAFALATMAAVRAHLAEERQAFIVDRDLIMGQIRASEESFRTGLVGAELAWQENPQVDSTLVERFRSHGYQFALQPSPAVWPQWIFGIDGDGLPDDDIRRYLALAELLGRARTVHSLARGQQLPGYFYGTRHNVAGVMPSPSFADARLTATHADRQRLMAALADGLDNLADLRARGQPDQRPPMFWMPPAVSPLTGKMAIRLAAPAFHDGLPFATLVTEYAPDFLTAPLGVDRFDGTYLIVSSDGKTVASTSARKADSTLMDFEHASDIAKTIGNTRHEVWRDGVFTIAERLGDTGWVLAYTFTWRDVAVGIEKQIYVSAGMTIATLAAVWAFLTYFRRRVFRPVLERSERVFESEHLSRTLIETAPVGLGLIAMKCGTPMLCGPTMVELARRVVVPALAAEVAARYRQHREREGSSGNDITHEELTLPMRDGGLVDLEVSVAPARYRGEDVLVTSFTDVTAHKRLEQTLREAREAADLASAAKSAFLATMSHEIRTPLNAILGNLELLSHSRLDALQRDRLKTIRGSSDALLAIISDVLDFSKIEAGEMTLEHIGFDALEVASRSLTMFGPLARMKGVRLSGDFGVVTSLPMQGDPTRLGQVVNNLLSNAIKFTEHGEVRLRISVADSATLLIEMEDSGIGMTVEQQAAVFEPFSQADTTISRRFGGTGLGLTLSARLTRAMGGSITVRSEPGKGSCFTARVPLGKQAVAPAMPRFDGETVAFVAAADAWHVYAVPALWAWGLTVHASRHPVQIDEATLDEVAAIILCGERETWHADEENRLIEGARWVIDCSAEGPGSPVATGRLVSVSSFGLMGLASALQHVLRAAPLESAHEMPQVLQRPLKVLAVEDHTGNRMLLEEQLKLLGCEAVLAENGKTALARLVSERFDVLLTDLSMPEMDGYTLAGEARARWPGMPVIAATAATTLEERKRCEAVGIAQVVSKPLSLERLRTAMSEVAGLPAAAPQVDNMRTDVTRTEDTGEDLLGGRALPDEVRQAFLASFEVSIKTIAVTQRNNDAVRMLAELHSLRGTLGVFGTGGLEEQCARLESMVRDQGVAAAAEMIEAFDTQVRAAILLHMQHHAKRFM
ncbi:ATP-binding protein [Paraburkholderia sediminicola]|uniref:ATP-binding protein n=1 Tax=Paraburkholderia rhynchosiae TaxID=487049 RepID=A0ACC7NP81_9BURK